MCGGFFLVVKKEHAINNLCDCCCLFVKSIDQFLEVSAIQRKSNSAPKLISSLGWIRRDYRLQIIICSLYTLIYRKKLIRKDL